MPQGAAEQGGTTAGLSANLVRKQGSVPDQSALLAAKITVPDTDQVSCSNSMLDCKA